jgi:hypothetical protein
MISRKLEESRFTRGDLSDSVPWTLHTPDHGSKFLRHLPRIIDEVENGRFPERQAGDYDLDLDAWVDWFATMPQQ